MMFSDDELKEIPESSFSRPGDEIISVHEVWLGDKCSGDSKDLSVHNERILSSSTKNDIFRDSIFDLDHGQARFAWTEEDGNIASLVSEPGFGTTGQTTFGKALDELTSEMKEADTSSQSRQTSRSGMVFARKPAAGAVSSTSSNTALTSDRPKPTCKVDKADPRSRFHYVKYLKRQGRTVKLWECGICGREFQHQYTLMRHLPTHTDERNFHCDACGKSFRQLSTLSQHRAIHSADRPYCCEVCNKTFNRVSTLISHRKTHSEEKPYKCHICPKGFHQKGNLRNHLFTHTNERPYRCNICMKGFNQQSNLVCHRNKAHSEDGSFPGSKPRQQARVTFNVENKPDSTKTIPQVNYCEVSSSVGPYLSIDSPSSSKWSDSQPLSLVTASSSTKWTKIDDSLSFITQSNLKPKNLTPPRFQKESLSNTPSSCKWSTLNQSLRLIDASTNWLNNDAPKWSKFEDFLPKWETKIPDVWSDASLTSLLSEGTMNSGVIVDPIKTYHMGVAMATKQTPFALLKPTNGTPVLVKVVETKLPNGKQMLVPATAEDLRIGGKIVVNNDNCKIQNKPQPQSQDSNSGVQIRVPVVATVVPKIKPGGRLQLTVEEPTDSYHTAISADVGEVCVEPCAPPPPPPLHKHEPRAPMKPSGSGWLLPPPSPPLDLIAMDLFEPMELPMGPQITAVDNIDRPPRSDDSIFIGEFEETIQLSDSD